MFTTEAPEEITLGSWAAQQVLSTLAPLLLLGFTGLGLHNMGLMSESPPGRFLTGDR